MKSAWLKFSADFSGNMSPSSTNEKVNFSDEKWNSENQFFTTEEEKRKVLNWNLVQIFREIFLRVWQMKKVSFSGEKWNSENQFFTIEEEKRKVLDWNLMQIFREICLRVRRIKKVSFSHEKWNSENQFFTLEEWKRNRKFEKTLLKFRRNCSSFSAKN